MFLIGDSKYMKTRRGSSLWNNTLSGGTILNQYQPGDIVVSTLATPADFIGVVRAVDKKINKVFVSWAGGAVSQHDPDEIHLETKQSDIVRDRMASRRSVFAAIQDDPQFMGNPEKHGLETPIAGGFGVMQELVRQQKKESLQESKSGNPKTGSVELSSRRGSLCSSCV